VQADANCIETGKMALASSKTAVRVPFSGARSVAARPTSLRSSNAVFRPQQRISFAPVAAVTADITEFEEMAVDQEQDASSSAAVPAGQAKLRVRMRGYDIGILAKACEQIKVIAGMTGAKIAGPVMLPTKKKVYCVLRSPHVNKDAREHFEIRIHNRLIDVGNLSAQTVQALMEWVPPSGLEVETSIV
jgi:small subunit ribosomal protein S10